MQEINKKKIFNWLLSEETPIVLLLKHRSIGPLFDGMRGVGCIIAQTGKRVFVATVRHHFAVTQSTPDQWSYLRADKQCTPLRFVHVYYPQHASADYCIIELKTKHALPLKLPKLVALNSDALARVSDLVNVKNSFNGLGMKADIFFQEECLFREQLKVITNLSGSTLYNLLNENDTVKYNKLTDMQLAESIVFNAFSTPGTSGSPIIIEHANEYAMIGINQGGSQGGYFGDMMYCTPTKLIKELLKQAMKWNNTISVRICTEFFHKKISPYRRD